MNSSTHVYPTYQSHAEYEYIAFAVGCVNSMSFVLLFCVPFYCRIMFFVLLFYDSGQSTGITV